MCETAHCLTVWMFAGIINNLVWAAVLGLVFWKIVIAILKALPVV